MKIFFELNINAYLFHSFPLSESDNINIFEMVHVDVWEPFSSETYDQKRYFLTILNDLSKSTYLGVVEAIEIRFYLLVKIFISYAENQFSTRIKTIRSTNGKEIVKLFLL